LGEVAIKSYKLPNIALDPKSSEDGKFQISYFFQKVDYMTFPTSILSPKSVKYISKYDRSKWDISSFFLKIAKLQVAAVPSGVDPSQNQIYP
jgi:hypothetical protein